MAKKKKSPAHSNTIAMNRQAKHDFFIEDRFEAGICLQGWEVKSLREGKIQITESYVIMQNGEAFLVGAHITPLNTAAAHLHPTPTRSRKLLLHKKELDRLIGAVERKGYTLVPIAMYWSKGLAKLEIGLGKGKKLHDKRSSEKDRDWQREKQRLLKHG